MATDLPADVLTVVLSCLDTVDVISCAGTCANWRSVARTEALDRAKTLEPFWEAMRVIVRSDARRLRDTVMREQECTHPNAHIYVCAACMTGVDAIAMCRKCYGQPRLSESGPTFVRPPM
jgi:hypothetical protein